MIAQEEPFPVDVLIIGAGPAGLTAGYLLTKGGTFTVTILEADPRYVGGISRTENFKDFLFDIGGHRFFTKSPEVEALWHEILPADFITRPRISRIYYQRKFYSYPLRALEALFNLGLWESALCVASFLRAQIAPIRPVRSFSDWVTNQFGSRLFRIFFKTYTEKVWGMSCDEITADWAAQRIKGLNLFQAVWAGLRKSMGQKPISGRGKVIKTLIETFQYPRRGPGMMWEAAAAKIKAQGGTVLLGHKALRFAWDQEAGLWTVDAQDGNGGHRTFRARHVISSAPMRDVVAGIHPPAETAALARTLKYRDFLVVAIILNQTPDFTDNWIYVHDPAVKVGRIQNFSSWSPDMIPHDNGGCLGMEYFCFEGDGLWSMDDPALIDLACRELEILGLVDRRHVADGCVIRQAKAYPVYDEGYKDAVASIREEFANRFPTMHFVGRNGMHKYNNQDHAMMTAMLTAQNILAGQTLYDVWCVNEDAEYHEEASEADARRGGGLQPVPERRV